LRRRDSFGQRVTDWVYLTKTKSPPDLRSVICYFTARATHTLVGAMVMSAKPPTALLCVASSASAAETYHGYAARFGGRITTIACGSSPGWVLLLFLALVVPGDGCIEGRGQVRVGEQIDRRADGHGHGGMQHSVRHGLVRRARRRTLEIGGLAIFLPSALEEAALSLSEEALATAREAGGAGRIEAAEADVRQHGARGRAAARRGAPRRQRHGPRCRCVCRGGRVSANA
jgi:hypothetical protein